MHIDYAKPGMKLARDVIDTRGNLLLEKGIALTKKYIDHLKRLGITTVYIYVPGAAYTPPPVIPSELRSELTLCFASLFTLLTKEISSSKLQTLHFRKINELAGFTISEVEKNMPNILNVHVREPSTEEAVHAVNVCLLSIITGVYLRLPPTALRDLAVGSLLHDLGKSVIPMVNNKPVNSVHLHTLYGRDLLLQYKFTDPAALIAAQHHEMYNGSGFPLGLSGKGSHPLARIVSIANYFDNALAQAQIPRQEIAEYMLANAGTLFDFNILRAFMHTIAVYPAGSWVLLNTGETAFVIKNHATFPLRPIVRLKTSTDNIDLLHKPNITIIALLEEPLAV